MIVHTVPNIISDRKLCYTCRKYKGHCSADMYVPQVNIVVCNSAFELRSKIEAIWFWNCPSHVPNFIIVYPN